MVTSPDETIMSTKLNEKQLIAVHLLASGVRASIIAKEIGIREETLSRWRQIDEFKEALEDATEVVLREIDETHKNLLIRKSAIRIVRGDTSFCIRHDSMLCNASKHL